MATVVKRLYAATTATTNDAAHFDVPFSARIIGVDFSMGPILAADGDGVRAEVSTSSVGQHTINDCNGVIANCSYGYKLATNGGSNLGTNKYVGPIAVDIPMGTRIYLHVAQNGTSSTPIQVNVHLQR